MNSPFRRAASQLTVASRPLPIALLLALAAPASLHAQLDRNHPQPPANHVHNLTLGELTVGAAVMAATFLLDAPIAHVFQTPPSPASTRAAHLFNNFGAAAGMGTVIGGLGIASAITHNRRLLQATRDAAEGLVIAVGATTALKIVIGRQRPYADPDRDGLDFHFFRGTVSGYEAFPSGHVTVAFELATSLGDAINRDWARVALFGLATGTGWARLQQQQHWVTDVVAAAAIGIVGAKLAEGKLKILGIAAPRLIIGRGKLGVSFDLRR